MAADFNIFIYFFNIYIFFFCIVRNSKDWRFERWPFIREKKTFLRDKPIRISERYDYPYFREIRLSVFQIDKTIHIGSTPTFLLFDLYLNTAYAAHYIYVNSKESFIVQSFYSLTSNKLQNKLF